MARGVETAVGPQHDLAITGGARKRDALGNQTSADPQPARRRLDQEQSQLRDRWRAANQEDRADVLTVALGNPAALELRIEALQEFRRDFGDQPLECVVPAVFLGVERAVTRDDPTDVARAV